LNNIEWAMTDIAIEDQNILGIFRRFLSSVLPVLLACLIALACAATLSADDVDKVHSVPFLNGVEVLLNAHGPYRFGLDTGSGSAFIISPELAQELRLPVTGHTKMRAARKFKSDPDVQIVHVNEMTLAGHMVRDAIGMPIENSSPMVKDGMGTLGMAAFKDVVLHLDFAGDKLWLSDEALPKPDGSKVLPYSNVHLRPYVEISLNNIRVKAQVDTGARTAQCDLFIPRALAAKLALMDRKPGDRKVPDSNGREYVFETAKLDGDLRIGNAVVPNPTVMIGDFAQYVILARVINRLTIAIDQKHHRIQLELAGAHSSSPTLQ
jgi:hypothetical protein